MEDTETKSEIEDVGKFVIKQESLVEEDGLELQHIQTHQPRNAVKNYPTVQTQVKEESPRVSSQSNETCVLVKQEPRTCDGEAVVLCTIIKTENLAGQTSSSPLDDAKQRGGGRPDCKIEPEFIVQDTAKVPSIWKTGTLMTNSVGCRNHESHSSRSLSLNLTSNDIPYPVALYQHVQPLASDESDQTKSHHNILLESTSGRCKSTSTTPEQTLNESEKEKHRCSVWDCCSACKMYLASHTRTNTREKSYKIFKCSTCNYSTAQKSSLVVHTRTHTGEKPYKCSVCDYRSSQKGMLSIHMRTHTGEKPFRCTVCDYCSVRKTQLVSHMRTHTGEKPYKCSICDYRASRQGWITIHMRTHTGEKPYRCTVCDYRATRKGRLVIHMRTHTGEKPFKCTVCDYSSAQKTHITVHMRTHTREKPYKCSICEHRSTNKRVIIAHMKTHTGEKP